VSEFRVDNARLSVRAVSSRCPRASPIAQRRANPAAPESIRHAPRAGRACRAARHQTGIAGRRVARDDRRGEQPESQRLGAAESARRSRDRAAVHRDRAARRLSVRGARRDRRRIRATLRRVAVAGRQSAAGNQVLHDERRYSTRICNDRRRTTARQSVELAHPFGLRMGQPHLAALVRRAVASSSPRSLRRARQRHVAARRGRRELRHVGPAIWKPSSTRRDSIGFRSSASRAADRSRSRTRSSIPSA
jgi:hypothetical protein